MAKLAPTTTQDWQIADVTEELQGCSNYPCQIYKKLYNVSFT